MGSAVVQIFIVTSGDQVPFYFSNDVGTLQENSENVGKRRLLFTISENLDRTVTFQPVSLG